MCSFLPSFTCCFSLECMGVRSSRAWTSVLIQNGIVLGLVEVKRQRNGGRGLDNVFVVTFGGHFFRLSSAECLLHTWWWFILLCITTLFVPILCLWFYGSTVLRTPSICWYLVHVHVYSLPVTWNGIDSILLESAFQRLLTYSQQTPRSSCNFGTVKGK